jgi:hypothetical protein
VQALRKSVWTFIKKLKTDLPYDLTIPFVGMYLKECSEHTGEVLMFTAVPFTTAKLRNQSRCQAPMNE